MKKKNAKKLHLHRDTLVLLDRQSASAVGGRVAVAIETSCTEPCGCNTGCSDGEACPQTAFGRG
jgi:hypothetical protein